MANKLFKLNEDDLRSIADSTRRIVSSVKNYTVHEMAQALESYEGSSGSGNSLLNNVYAQMESGYVNGWYKKMYKVRGGGYINNAGEIVTPATNPASQFTKGGVLGYEDMLQCFPGELWSYWGGGIWSGTNDGTAMKGGVLFGFDADKNFKQVILSNRNYNGSVTIMKDSAEYAENEAEIRKNWQDITEETAEYVKVRNYTEFVIPEGVYYLNFHTWTGITSIIRKFGNHYEMTQADKELLEACMVANQYKQRNITKPRLAKPKKGFIVFCHDDMNYNPTEVAEEFAKRGLKLCWAHTGDFNTVVPPVSGSEHFTTYMAKWELMKKGEALGFERLQHEGRVVTAENIDNWDIMYEHFAGQREKAEWFGFAPKIYILAGGNGQITNDLRTDKWVRYFYGGSDLYGAPYPGESSDRNPTPWTGNAYFFGRGALSAQNTDEKILEFCQSVKRMVDEGRWQAYYLHGFGDLSKERLQTLLDFIVENDIPVLTYSEAYAQLSTMDALYDKSLVSISATATKTQFNEGDAVDKNTLGLVVTATYDDGSTEDVTVRATISVPSLVVGDNIITVSYGGKEITIRVTVVATDAPDVPEQPAGEWAEFTVGSWGRVDVPFEPAITWMNGDDLSLEFDYKISKPLSAGARVQLSTYGPDLPAISADEVYHYSATMQANAHSNGEKTSFTFIVNGKLSSTAGDATLYVKNVRALNLTQSVPEEPEPPVDDGNIYTTLTYTNGKDYADIATVHLEAGKSYTLSFDWLADCANLLSTANAKVYSHDLGLTGKTVIFYTGQPTRSGSVTEEITTVATTGDYLIQWYDVGGVAASAGSIDFVISNFKVEDTTPEPEEPEEPDTPVDIDPTEWQSSATLVTTEGRDKQEFDYTFNIEKGKKYRYEFDYISDGREYTGTNITMYNWSSGINKNLTVVPGQISDVKHVSVEGTAGNPTTKPFILDDQNSTTIRGTVTVYLKNISITEVQ